MTITSVDQAANHDGRQEAFEMTSVAGAAVVNHKWQTTVGTWAGSSDMTLLVTDAGSIALDPTKPLTAMTRPADGCIELSAVAADGSFAHTSQKGANGAGGWHPWSNTF